MRTIDYSTKFRKELRRLERGSNAARIRTELAAVINLLITDQPLLARHRDHALRGRWKGFRDCHVLPDIVLIYRKTDESGLHLISIGTHSELGL